MIREVILNSFASMLSKKDRDGLNSAVRSIIANPKTFLDNKAFNDYQDWLYYNGGSDRALSPLTLRVFSIVAEVKNLLIWQMLKRISRSSKLDIMRRNV